MNFLKKTEDSNCLMSLSFQKDSQHIEVVCSIPKLTDLLKDHELEIQDSITTLRRLIPDKHSKENIEIQLWFFNNTSVKTTLNYPRKLKRYLKVPGQIIIEKLNSILSDLVKRVLLNGIIYG